MIERLLHHRQSSSSRTVGSLSTAAGGPRSLPTRPSREADTWGNLPRLLGLQKPDSGENFRWPRALMKQRWMLLFGPASTKSENLTVSRISGGSSFAGLASSKVRNSMPFGEIRQRSIGERESRRFAFRGTEKPDSDPISRCHRKTSSGRGRGHCCQAVTKSKGARNGGWARLGTGVLLAGICPVSRAARPKSYLPSSPTPTPPGPILEHAPCVLSGCCSVSSPPGL